MPKRRANGEGNIRKRKDGRWEGRYTAGYSKRHKEMPLKYQANVLCFQAEQRECLPCQQESIIRIQANCLPKGFR